MKVTQPYLLVLLRRSENEKTPLVVFPHEIDVLESLHGQGTIITTEETPPVLEAEFDTEEEYSRLQQIYIGNDRTPNPVRDALGDEDEFTASFKGKSKPKTTASNSGEGGNEEKDALVAKAKVLGIKSPHLFSVEKLKEKIEEAEAEKIIALVDKAKGLNIEVQEDWDIPTLEAEISKAQG